MRSLKTFLLAAAFGFGGSALCSEGTLSGASLELVWSVDGDWSDVAAQAGSSIVYATRAHQLLSVDLKDGSVAELAGGFGTRVRVGVNDGQAMIVGFDPWGETIAAYNTKGERLWNYDTGDAVDDVWPIDLDGNGNSELLVGLNGDGGLLVLTAAGKVLWADHSIGDVWHVTAGPLDGKDLRILTTAADGKVHVFSATGERIATQKARCYGTHVRLSDRPVVGGSNESGSVVATLAPSGWIATVTPKTTGIGAVAADSSIPWIGVSTVDGDVYALRASSGAMEEVASGMGRSPELAWAKDGDATLLLVASRGSLRSYRVAQSR